MGLTDDETVELAGHKFRVLIFEDSSIDRKKLALYSPDEKILFSGDLSLDEFKGLDIEEIYPAHGEPVKESEESLSE